MTAVTVFHILALWLYLEFKYSHALVHPMQSLPLELQETLDTCQSIGDLSKQSGQLVLWSSIQQYVSKFFVCDLNLTKPEAKLFESAMYEIMRPLLDNNGTYGQRNKRQAAPRIRYEIRTIPLSERQRYFRALNEARNDRRLTPNVYEVIARLHSGQNIRRAHIGPAFVGWHRLYLYIFESLLRLWYDPEVTIPYWASYLDDFMFDPTLSPIWSDEFFGNGFDNVVSGPFAGWNIRRNVGGGPLMSLDAVNRVISRNLNEEILLPLARFDSNLEQIHGGPHNFVGGTMANLNRAAFDPIFFSHHSYVDYVWEQFRIRQRASGTNPEADYPFVANDPRYRREHDPNANAGFIDVGTSTTVLGIQLSALTQRIGYSNAFFDLVQYQDHPSCPDCDGSSYLYCETSINECVSLSIDEVAMARGFEQTATQAPPSATTVDNLQANVESLQAINNNLQNNIENSQNAFGNEQNVNDNPQTVFDNTFNDIGNAQAARDNQQGNFDNSNTIIDRRNSQFFINNVHTTKPPSPATPTPDTKPQTKYIPRPRGRCGRYELIHDVNMKEMSDSGDWAYIPFNVVSKRPDTITGFEHYSLYKPKTSWANETLLGYKYEFLKSGYQYEFEGCKNRQGAVGRISVVSWGINYDGHAEEYVVVDNRFGVSQGNGFLPIKRPTASNPSEFIAAAYDSCGRICKPYLNSKIFGSINMNFGGGFRVTSESPHQYSNSYEEAILGIWEVDSPTYSPIIDYTDLPITFFCEYTNKWLWDKPKPPPTGAPMTTAAPPTIKQRAYQPKTYNEKGNRWQKFIAENGNNVSGQTSVTYGKYNTNSCVVATDCVIDVSCRGCSDFDYKYCRGRKKIAICTYGQYSVTAYTEAYYNHFYSK